MDYTPSVRAKTESDRKFKCGTQVFLSTIIILSCHFRRKGSKVKFTTVLVQNGS